MAFSEQVKKAAWDKAGGCCEKCGKKLSWESHEEGEWGAWEAHHKTSVAAGGKDVASNCMILCLNCHKKTRTFGQHL